MIDEEIEEIFELIRGQIANHLALQTYAPLAFPAWTKKKEHGSWTNYVLGYPSLSGGGDHLAAAEHLFNYWKSKKKKQP